MAKLAIVLLYSSEYDINAKFIIFFPVVLSSCPADEKSGGTQVKMVLTFRDGGQSLMKPWR